MATDEEKLTNALSAASLEEGNAKIRAAPPKEKIKVVYKLRDLNRKLVCSWGEAFSAYKDRIEVSQGDIFKDGPQADAIVSPANSFGFMDGGIDMAYSRHFGWQMQTRLQRVIREEFHGEVLQGQVAIIPSYGEGQTLQSVAVPGCNGSEPIPWLISAPTMRVPMDVSKTVNVYLAFRAVILAVEKHNASGLEPPIRSVLCPGLGTAIGCVSPEQCAHQMLMAFEVFDQGLKKIMVAPPQLSDTMTAHFQMTTHGISRPIPSSSIKPASNKTHKEEKKVAEEPRRPVGWLQMTVWSLGALAVLAAAFYVEMVMVGGEGEEAEVAE